VSFTFGTAAAQIALFPFYDRFSMILKIVHQFCQQLQPFGAFAPKDDSGFLAALELVPCTLSNPLCHPELAKDPGENMKVKRHSQRERLVSRRSVPFSGKLLSRSFVAFAPQDDSGVCFEYRAGI